MYNEAYFGQDHFTYTLDSLYGRVYLFPILELKDTTRFVYNWGLGIGVYNYYVLMPPDQMTTKSLMARMQADLKCSFGYTATIETRDMPVWKLIAEPSAEKQIKAKGDVTYNSTFERVYAGGFWVKNTPFKDFYWTLTSYLAVDEKEVFINATGITGPVDIAIDADLTDFNDVQRALKKYHMKFVRSTASMKVLVIRD